MKDPEHFYSRYFIVQLSLVLLTFIAVAPWYVQQIFFSHDHDMAVVFRVFVYSGCFNWNTSVEAFTKLDDVSG